MSNHEISTQAGYDEAKAILREASAAYYGTGDATMSDAEFDALLDAVTAYEVEHGVTTDTVGTQVAAGAAVSGDVEHSVPMLSLDKVTDATALDAFIAKVPGPYTVEPKLDGLAMSIRYEDGVPVQMVTRGDGLHGEDVTYALPVLTNLPTLAQGPSHSDGGIATRDIRSFTGEVRGEVIFTRDQFEAAQALRAEHGDKVFANARNGAAGALRGAKDRDYVIGMSFFAYDAVGLDAHSHTAVMALLTNRGFATAASLASTDSQYDAAQVHTLISHFEDRANRDALPVETDGMVIKTNLHATREALGAGSRAPRWAVAYKFAPDEVTSVLRTIHWQVGRTGVITPRAEIDEVFVGGTLIRFATLHNVEDIERKGFMLGDTVLVKRAGEVIPRLEAPLVAKRDGSQTPIVAPTACPRCDGALDYSEVRIRCARGRDCGTAESVAYAVSRDALDIEGLGKTQVTNLVASGTVGDVADLFTLTADDLIVGGKVAPANAVKVLAQIEKAKTAGFARVLIACGIRKTGRTMSRRIAKHFGTMDALLAASITDLSAVDGIGDGKAGSIAAELDTLRDVIARMAASGVDMTVTDTAPVAADGAPAGVPPLAGMSVCVSGTMTTRGRSQMNELVEANGGRAASSVSKSTSILVAGPGAGSKLAKAEQFGVKVLTEDEFLTMLGFA